MMRWSIILGLVVAAVIVGVAGLFIYINRILDAPSLPIQPNDAPVVVFDAPTPASELRPLVALPDLSKVDRSLNEPVGMHKPRYCLLVFGLQAKTRVWLVEDGETLYVDCNANGDLSEAGKGFAPAEREEFTIREEDGKDAPYRTWTYLPGDVAPIDRAEKHTGLKLGRVDEF